MADNVNITNLKRFIDQYLNNRQFAKITQGTVVSTNPLQIRLDNSLVIDGEVISLTWTDKLDSKMLNKKVTLIRQDGGGHYHVLYTDEASAGTPKGSNTGTTPISQPSAVTFDNSKSSGATAVSTTGWSQAWVDKFNMNAADPSYVNGSYIDNFLRNFYPDSPLIGQGDVIKEMSDYFGISVGAAIGVWAKETTFGRGHPGAVDFNYGCIRWTSGSGFPSVTYAGSQWVKYPNARTGIAAWFILLRYNYLEKGYVNYRDFLNRYSPSFENNQATFKNIMWGVLKSFGYDTADTQTKKNYSSSTDKALNFTVPTGANTNNSGIVHSSNAWLNTSQMEENARYIWNVLKNFGWTEQAIAGFLGNTHVESTHNPGIWEGLNANVMTRGFGLVQYTPASLFINWAKDQGLIETSIDVQLNAINNDQFGHWIATTEFNYNFDAFKKSTSTPETLARAFMRNFERPANQTQPGRGTHARAWYNKFSGTNTPAPNPNTGSNSKIEAMISWFNTRLGKVRYSMAARTGPNSYDCSSAVFSALIYAGFVAKGTWLGTTETLFGYEGGLLQRIDRSQVRRGDIFVAGTPGASMYSAGHTGVAINANQIIHCTYPKNGIAITPIAGWTGSPVRWYRLRGT